MGRHTALALPLPDTAEQDIRWFSGTACVWYRSAVAEVFVGGTLIGSFGPKDIGVRNTLLVGLADEPRIKKGKLAWAFGVSSEQLRRVRRHVESNGLDGIPSRARGGRQTKVTPTLTLPRKSGQVDHAAIAASCSNRFSNSAGLR
jgi:hypothetical protein